MGLAIASDHGTHRPRELVVTVKASPTAPWIEVYHDGQLTSEWQPADGAIYQLLSRLLDDDFYVAPPSNCRPAVPALLAAL